MILVWAVFLIGPNTMMPAHHYRPVVWSTEEKCKAEIDRLLATKQVEIMDTDYHLECMPVPDMSGDPA